MNSAEDDLETQVFLTPAYTLSAYMRSLEERGVGGRGALHLRTVQVAHSPAPTPFLTFISFMCLPGQQKLDPLELE